MALDIHELEAVTAAQMGTHEFLSERSPEASPDCIPAPGYYQIEDIRQSECALILFARHTLTSERLVMKILREYKDTRYSLTTLDERQQCQLEALERNRVFTPEVYIGLARIDYLDLPQGRFAIEEIIRSSTPGGISLLGLEQGCFPIEEIIANPTQEILDHDAEYTLVMCQLPEERRLDHLLSEESEDALLDYMQLLSKYVAYMHTNLVKPLDVDEDKTKWGSYEQLHCKLLHNLGLLDLVLTTSILDQHFTFDLSKDTLHWLKETLLQVITESHYRSYFEQRVREQRIKRCHGDLKSPNIWILPPSQSCNGKPGEFVKILDAIDFNSAYSNIDTLSDFAMLVTDVQTRTKSPVLADEMVKYYLESTGQNNQTARSVLGYYLVEKAIVGAAISIVYDNLPELGLSLLEIAKTRLQCLLERNALI
jgi:aminoglycoside phosphotransferase family enzyme